jgi:hypothetical protein
MGAAARYDRHPPLVHVAAKRGGRRLRRKWDKSQRSLNGAPWERRPRRRVGDHHAVGALMSDGRSGHALRLGNH